MPPEPTIPMRRSWQNSDGHERTQTSKSIAWVSGFRYHLGIAGWQCSQRVGCFSVDGVRGKGYPVETATKALNWRPANTLAGRLRNGHDTQGCSPFAPA